jgi:putative membrane protein
VIDPERIQNVELVRNLFHKLAGLVELRIETAGERGAEGLLSAVSEAEAHDLRARLYAAPEHRGSPGSAPSQAGTSVDAPAGGSGARPDGPPAFRRPGPPEPGRAEVLHDLGLAELLGYGVSAGRVGAAVIVAGVLLEWGGLFAPGALRDTVGQLRGATAIGLVLFTLAGAYVTSVIGAVVRHSGFRMVRSPRGVRIEGGLFTTRGVEIPLGKVQVVRVEEPLVRRLMGYGSMHVETAASGAPQEEAAAEGFVPMVPGDELARVAGVVLPRLDVDPWSQRLRPPAARALRRAVFARTLRWGVVAGGAAAFGGQIGLLALALLGPVLAWADWRGQGWWVSARSIVSRRGFLRRDTWILPRDKVQSAHIGQGPLQRWHGLASVELWAAGTRVVLPDLDEDEARRVFAAVASR